MRHGQTDWNVQGLFQGDTDVPLNATGIAQAEEAAASLTEGQVDLIVCSTLQRAGQTADIVNRALKCPIIYREELIERGFGEWEGKEIAPIRQDPFFATGALYNYNWPETPYGIEPIRVFCARIWGLLDELREYYPERKILLVTHGGTIRGIHAYFTGVKEDGSIEKIITRNCQLWQYTV